MSPKSSVVNAHDVATKGAMPIVAGAIPNYMPALTGIMSALRSFDIDCAPVYAAGRPHN